MAYETTIYHKEGGIGRITINRPQAMNAITPAMLGELKAAVLEAGKDTEVKVIVLTGAGKAFCAGVDLKALGSGTLDKGKVGDILDKPAKEQINAIRTGVIRARSLDEMLNMPARDLINAIRTVPKAVIALVNGYCFTGGLEIMLGCDIVIASEEAKIGDTHAKWGLRPTWGMSARLPRRVGFLKAMEMSFTADAISGKEAERIGLVNMAVPHDRLEEALKILTGKIMANSLESIAAYKHLYNTNESMTLDKSLDLEYGTEFDISDTLERLGQFRK